MIGPVIFPRNHRAQRSVYPRRSGPQLFESLEALSLVLAQIGAKTLAAPRYLKNSSHNHGAQCDTIDGPPATTKSPCSSSWEGCLCWREASLGCRSLVLIWTLPSPRTDAAYSTSQQAPTTGERSRRAPRSRRICSFWISCVLLR